MDHLDHVLDCSQTEQVLGIYASVMSTDTQ